MMEILKLEFGRVELHDCFMIAVIDEGETIDIIKAEKLNDLAKATYDKPFVYITHRMHSYAVDPSVYKSTSRIKNLVGFGIVSSNYMAKSNAMIEKLFLNKPLEIFDTIDEAVSWAHYLTER